VGTQTVFKGVQVWPVSRVGIPASKLQFKLHILLT